MVNVIQDVIEGQSLADAIGHIGPLPCEFGVRGIAGTSVGLTDAILSRHILFLGGIGTGKSVGMHALVESIRAGLGQDDVLVFFDTKGDYVDAFGRAGDVVVGAVQQSPEAKSVVWNIFEEFGAAPDGRDVEDEIYEVSSGLFANLLQNSGDNIYFVSAARDLFVALLTAMLRESVVRTNADIRGGIAGMSVAEMHEVLDRPGNEDLRGVKQYIAREGSPSTGATVAFMQQVIQESFRSSFGRSGDFSIRRFLREKGGHALFLEYDIAAGSTLGPIFKTMLDIAMQEAMSRTRTVGRVLFVLDEFALLPELAHLTNGLNFGRSLGLRFIVGTQNVKQVEAMYGPQMAMSVLSAFGTVFSFRLFDGPSRDFVRDRYGRNKKIIRFDSSVRSKGLNESIIDGYVVEDWDLSALPVGTCVAATPDTAPVRFAFARR
ncbi:type IV secretory system conjugative DNA transfer family protein [Microbacterium sp. SA39]|uniref:type IV secretory system conjugative DNA transfer family protein n=1 Tax=Microbacterium sp. SA39 TaxID=1263625 RepID=UPI0006200496|nr:type IV secretion system DNA-binding domain-containing protein [Microbacterium sp. SA39]KJQ53704.1 Type IV secretion-system coupling protein DNA-binding domain protein [Microbacterium sp. SA39]